MTFSGLTELKGGYQNRLKVKSIRMRTYNILMFIEYPPNDKRAGGGQAVSWNTMLGLAQKGHNLDVVIGKSNVDLPSIEGVKFHTSTYFSGRRPISLMCALDWLKKSIDINKVDVAHDFRQEAVLIAGYYRLRNIPLVHEVHFPRLYPYSLRDIRKEGSMFNHKLIRWSMYLHLDKLTSHLGTRVVVPSQYSKNRLSEIYGIREEKINNIPPGVDLKRFQNRDLERDELRLITVGRLEPQKGMDTLLKAYADVLKVYPEAHLDIVGTESKPGYFKYLKDLCEQNHLKNVDFKGFLPASEISELLNEASVFVLPSRTEGMPVVVMEAMASGLPVVSTNVCGIPELVVDGETGFLVNPEDPKKTGEKIIILLGDKKLRTKFGMNGSKRVQENFSWPKRVEKVEKLYEELFTSC
jgi:glycosyltransferase involved in cell wall biosynthesis